MSTYGDFDRYAAAFMADGPTQLADRVLDGALREIHLTHQRRGLRVARRFSPMLRIAALAATIVVVVAGGILLAGGGRIAVPSASPSASHALSTIAPTDAAPVATAKATSAIAPGPTMPPLSGTYSSKWYGYTVAYPTGWQATDGQGPWPVGRNLQHGDNHLDEIRGPVGTTEARIVGASVALPAGMDLAGFMAFASSGPNSCPALDPLQEPVYISGIQATVTLNGCQSESDLGGLIWDVVVVAGGRGYDFTIDGAVTSAEAQAWLDSIWLLPTSARQ